MNRNRISINILFVVTIFYWMALYAYTSYVNPELERMGTTASFMGFTAGAYGFTQMLLRLPVGIMSDKWQKKFFICAGCLFSALASFCMLFFYTPGAFLIGRALGGIAASAWVPFSVLYSSYYKPEESTKSMTLINMAVQIGRLLSFILAGVIVAKFGVKSAFLISTIGGLVGFVLSLFIYEENDLKREPVSIRALLGVAKNRTLIVTSVLAVFFQIISFATFFTFTANHAFAIGATPAELSYINVAVLVPSIILSFLIGKYILNYIKAEWLIVIGFISAALYCWLLPFTETIMQLYALQALAGTTLTLVFSMLMGLCVRDISPEKRGAAMGLITDFLSLRAGFFIMSGVSVILAIVTVATFYKKT